MDIKKLLIGGIVGAILFFGLGYLIYGKLLMTFMQNHAGSTSEGVNLAEDKLRFLYIALGSLMHGLLLAYIFVKANVKSVGSGLVTGGVVGLLVSAGKDCLTYGTTNIMSKTGMAVDVAATTVMVAIIGAIVAMVMNMGKKEG